MPNRIQLRRTKDWRKPEDAVVVSRPGRWGNPFKGDDAAAKFSRYIQARRARWPGWTDWVKYPSDREIAASLHGRVLACWCSLDEPCHADVLLEIANPPVVLS